MEDSNMGSKNRNNREKKKKAVLSIKDKRRLKRERNMQNNQINLLDTDS